MTYETCRSPFVLLYFYPVHSNPKGNDVKVFRERAGVIGDEPVWVGIKDGKEVRFATSLTRLLSAFGCAVTELPAAE